jgi:hypothetical protein
MGTRRGFECLIIASGLYRPLSQMLMRFDSVWCKASGEITPGSTVYYAVSNLWCDTSLSCTGCQVNVLQALWRCTRLPNAVAGFGSPVGLVIFATAEERKAYRIRHEMVRKVRGRAKSYLCAGCCGKRAEEWATVHGTDGLKPGDYVSLCHGCHFEYDWPNGRPQTRETRRKLRDANRGKILSLAHVEKIRRANIGQSKLGKPSGFTGLHHSEETRLRMASRYDSPHLAVRLVKAQN